MGGAAVVLVMLVGVLTIKGQEETIPEDPSAEYCVRIIKTLLANSTYSLQDTLTRFEDAAAKETSVADLQDSLKDMKDSVVSLERNVDKIRNSVDNGVDRTRVELRMFRDRVSEELADLRQLMKDITEEMKKKVVEIIPTDCQDLYQLGRNATGVYHILKHGKDVFCEMEEGDGGWLVIQRRARVAEQVNFDRDWDEYKAGFGDLETEFWIGNDFLHVLTNQKNYQLRIDFNDYEKGPYRVSYSDFRVGGEDSGYTLDLGDFSGNVSDAFSYHHDRPFSTRDRDNDLFTTGNCALSFTGGWWYDRCYDAHLNGIFPVISDRQNDTFLTWWAHEGSKRIPLVLDKVTMKIKPV